MNVKKKWTDKGRTRGAMNGGNRDGKKNKKQR